MTISHINKLSINYCLHFTVVDNVAMTSPPHFHRLKKMSLRLQTCILSIHFPWKFLVIVVLKNHLTIILYGYKNNIFNIYISLFMLNFHNASFNSAGMFRRSMQRMSEVVTSDIQSKCDERYAHDHHHLRYNHCYR